MSDSPLDEILGFGLGKALFGGSTASERERERLQRERQHRELMNALAATQRQTAGSGGDWCRIEGDVALVGITDALQKNSGGIVFVELPAVGTSVIAGEPCFCIEFVTGTKDFYAPFTGVIVERNQTAIDHAEIFDTSPAHQIWLVKIKVTPPTQSQATTEPHIAAKTQEGWGEEYLPRQKKLKELKVSCPHCTGHIAFSLAEFGGQVIECPHCSQLLQLPSV